MTEPTDISVRMYDVGFGDCFLIRFPGDGRPVKVLVDCGTLASGPHPLEQVVGDLIADIRDPDGTPRLDVVVATHRHRDHVEGFARQGWDEVEVGAVWLPWTEDPEASAATDFRSAQERIATSLMNVGSMEEEERQPDMATLAQNGLPDPDAMAMLHSGFANGVRASFLAEDLPAPTLPDAPGVNVHVLGPSRDPAVIKDMDPIASETYRPEALRRALVEQVSWGDVFDEIWTGGRAEHLAEAAPSLPLTPENAPAAAVAFQSYVNNTSIVLVFEVGRQCLLFPGDAQWGTWNMMLGREDVRDLLARTSLYKVGHHGSHNATPKTFVEQLLPPAAWALASVKVVDRLGWERIPEPLLMSALQGRTGRAIESDEPAPALDGLSAVEGRYIDCVLSVP